MATKADQVTTRRVYRAEDIAKLMDCSKSKAYKLMSQVNERLKAKGFLTVSGRVPADFADEQLGLNVRGVMR